MEYITYSQKDYIGTIVINRPGALNALNNQILDELDDVLENLSGQDLRCLILTGAGEKAFVAGADIGEMKDMTREEARDYCLKGNAVFRNLEAQPVPVIARVDGYTLGGGCELMLAADIRLASDKSIFGLPETGLGIIPGFGGIQRLVRLVGSGRAKELLYTAGKIDAAKAQAIGLVNAVYSPAELPGKVMEMAEAIAANAPIAVKASKQVIAEAVQNDFNRIMFMEAEYFKVCFETEDQREAMTAFVEKRAVKPFQNV